MKLPFITSRPKAGNGKRKSDFREWLDSAVFAIVAATLIRWLFMEAFVIPTPSMEHTLLAGDYLFVSKLHYGTRTPSTPLQLPLTHKTIWGTDIPSYLPLEVPSLRLPGFSEVKRNDVVVFNYPVEFDSPVDMKTNYIKRCIGAPGDIVQVKAGDVYINGKPGENPAEMQYQYYVQSDEFINERVFVKLGINEVIQDAGGYVVFTTPAIAAELKTFSYVKDVVKMLVPDNQPDPEVYPQSSMFAWNRDFFGPLQVPAEGQEMPMTPENVAKYTFTIKHYEGFDTADVQAKGGKLYIKDQLQTSYTFKQNYYFMMGDNRHNSLDSRFWGFVPADHVVGKAWFIWLSSVTTPLRQGENKLRFSRMFTGIK